MAIQNYGKHALFNNYQVALKLIKNYLISKYYNYANKSIHMRKYRVVRRFLWDTEWRQKFFVLFCFDSKVWLLYHDVFYQPRLSYLYRYLYSVVIIKQYRMANKSLSFVVHRAPPFICCVALDKLLNLFVLHFLICNGPTLLGCCEN